MAAVVKDGRVLMGLRHYTSDKWKTISVWTLPGGRCDGGETLGETLLREAREETGLDLEPLEYLGEVAGAKEGDRVPMFLCHASGEPELLEPQKFSEWKWFCASEIPGNFINAEALPIIKRILNA
ncbi:MAG TPA: NUDIX domain-containing protein [Candidatus Paceibacterota bacterium]|nr:NUDIX domain-containing protein [Candidatus Paceibacterota bacterium]